MIYSVLAVLNCKMHKLLDNSKSSMMLVSDEDGKLVLCNDACELFEKISKPFAVLSICGKARTGKSYFLSRLLGGNDAFKASDSDEVCTRGIQMTTTTLDFGEFEVVLLDTEGSSAGMVDEQNRTDLIVKILVLTTLLSSTLIYNTQGMIGLDHIRALR